MSVWPKESAMREFYGDPMSPNFASANLVAIKPPYPLYYPSTDASGEIVTVRGHQWGVGKLQLRVHKKCAEAMIAALAEIGATFSESERRLFELDICAGAYVLRNVRGSSTKLSTHAYGAAIDLAHLLNPLGKKFTPGRNMMPPDARRAFADVSATWGGIFKRPDCMHFQFATI